MPFTEIYHSKPIQNLAFLVTGGAGFIGANLVEYLLQHGAKKVRVLDNLSNGHYKNIAPFINHPAFEYMEGDIRDLTTCQQACKNIDLVAHQAALGSVPRSIKDPITTNEVNIAGFLNMLVTVRDQGVKRMVYAASSSTYGDSQELPKVEDRIGKPLSPYAVTKYVNELYADVFAKTYSMDLIGLRYFNVFGPKQDPNGAYAAVIPLFIKAALAGTPAHINGDGETTRDFTFVQNVVQANIKALLVERSSLTHEVYNIAFGERTSLNELWQFINEEAGTNVAKVHGNIRQGDIKDSLANIDKAKSFLSYHPLYNIRQGIKHTIEWFKTQE